MITVVVQETRHVVEVGNPDVVVVAEPVIQTVEVPTQITVVIPQIVTNIVEVTQGVPNPTLVFKTADETNNTTSFTNDDELHFEVVEGSLYRMRASYYLQSDNDDLTLRFKYDIPTGVTGVLQAFGHGDPTTSLDGAGDEGGIEIGSESMLIQEAFIDCTSMVGATGTVTFQFRNPDGNSSGGVTVKAGSFIELFKVS